jgi:hypothetical protein
MSAKAAAPSTWATPSRCLSVNLLRAITERLCNVLASIGCPLHRLAVVHVYLAILSATATNFRRLFETPIAKSALFIAWRARFGAT